MTLACFYRESDGKLLRVTRTAHDRHFLKRVNGGPGKRGIVMQCPKEVFHSSASYIRQHYRVCNESNGFVEIEYAE